MKYYLVIAMAVSVMLTGCGTTTEIYDPAREKTGYRQEGHVSSEEMREIARNAINNFKVNPRVKRFFREYRKEMKNQEAVPILKLNKTVNETDDPDLNVNEMTDMISMELINSALVDVTMAEGYGLTKSIGKSRDQEDDDNFDQKTVAQRGTLQAARLLMRPKIMSNTTRDGRHKGIVRTFTADVADIKTGMIIWRYSKQLAFKKNKGVVGW